METRTEIQQRQIAYKVLINALLSNEYVEQEGWNPNYVKINGKQVSRVNLIATVIDKQASTSLATIVLDDSTGIIQARSFNDDVKKVVDINPGDSVLVTGKLRKFNDQRFITIEILKKINPLWMKVRKLELQNEFNIGVQRDENDNGRNIEAKMQLNQHNEKILEIIKNIDNGNGADIDEVISSSGLSESGAHEAIIELIKLGEIYEPRPNKIKILG